MIWNGGTSSSFYFLGLRGFSSSICSWANGQLQGLRISRLELLWSWFCRILLRSWRLSFPLIFHLLRIWLHIAVIRLAFLFWYFLGILCRHGHALHIAALSFVAAITIARCIMFFLQKHWFLSCARRLSSTCRVVVIGGNWVGAWRAG